MKPIIHIIGGGTFSHVRSHLALSAPAFGTTARRIHSLLSGETDFETYLWLTKMAGGHQLETNQDVSKLLDGFLGVPQTKVIFFNVAMTDFEGSILDDFEKETDSGKYETRLKTSEGIRQMLLIPADKVITTIKQKRPDVFLVGFKTTCNADFAEQHKAGSKLLRDAKCDLVLANDVGTRENMLLTSTELYAQTTDRAEAIEDLVKLTLKSIII
jgi:phosphopantothenoylcysteine synthetase/decarboxylase